jgi:hypothetical protein
MSRALPIASGYLHTRHRHYVNSRPRLERYELMSLARYLMHSPAIFNGRRSALVADTRPAISWLSSYNMHRFAFASFLNIGQTRRRPSICALPVTIIYLLRLLYYYYNNNNHNNNNNNSSNNNNNNNNN